MLAELLGESKQGGYDRGTTQYQWNCPWCADEKGGWDNKYNLEVSFSLGKYHCWSCGASGQISRLIKQRGGKSMADEYFRIVNDIRESRFYDLEMFKDFGDNVLEGRYLKLPKTFKKIDIENCRDNELVAYLEKRKITQSIIDYYNIGATTWDEEDWSWRNRIVIPSYNTIGDLNFYLGRLYRERDKCRKDKYKNCDLKKNNIVLHEDKIQWDADIYLVEGGIDSIYYPNTIGMMGKFITKDTALYESLMEKANANVIICLDGDTEINETKRIYRVLNRGHLRGRVRYVRLGTKELPWKDFGEAYEAEEKTGLIKIMKSARDFSEIELVF